MPSERKLNVSLSMKIKGESTSVKVLPWDPFATLLNIFDQHETNKKNNDFKIVLRIKAYASFK
jgi:hypothetical protein